MCQILAVKTTYRNTSLFLNENFYSKAIENILNKKGGDYFSISINIPSNHFLETFLEKPTSPEKTSRYLDSLKTSLSPDDEVNILFFSRQQPEMEEDNVEEQPYYIYNEANSTNSLIAVHGTVYNDKELASKYNFEIKADTEVFKFLPSDAQEIKGTFVAFELTADGNLFIRDNGLKVWHKSLNIDNEHIGEVYATGSLSKININIEKEDKVFFIDNSNNNDSILIASFSTGMDISLSVFKALSDKKYRRLELIYFAWGSRAEAAEIEKLHEFAKFYTKHFDLPVVIDILQANTFFKEYFSMTGAPIPKIADERAFGEINETESPLAYVPYRNTMFITTLAAYAEAKNYQNVDFVFGLNLSEGMVFMDNSEGWLETVDNVVKYGGKDFAITGTYNVMAPYFPRTKTNMLKEFKEEFGMAILKQLLFLSHSCYYPDENGNPCGKCGSCILRDKAIAKVKL